MASDNFDLDWGDDPFDGDLDFDMDFDGEKKGKVRSFVTGFFSGLKDHTIGDTDARIKTLRMALPSNFSTTLNAFVTLNNTRKRVLDEIKDSRKEEIIEAAEIQIKYEGYIARERMIAAKLSRLESIKIKGKFNYTDP